MKIYSQSDFDSFEIDKDGFRLCPSGDYKNIRSFGEWCSFGDGCSFGMGCSFGRGCSYLSFVFKSVFCLYGIFKYPIIIYKNNEKYRISVGCETFDSLNEAVKKSREMGIYCNKTHKILKLLL